MRKITAVIVKGLILGTGLTLPIISFALPYSVCTDLSSCQPLADKGNVEAQYNLGDMYDEGLNGVTKDASKAADWYTKAANQGNLAAMIGIGDLYYNGNGVPKDLSQAFKWYQQAADQGSPKGQDFVGYAYDHGEGVTQDYKQAMDWYLKSADGGFGYGMFNIGHLYKGGLGVTADIIQAYGWFAAAAAADPTNDTFQSTKNEVYSSIPTDKRPQADQSAQTLIAKYVNKT